MIDYTPMGGGEGAGGDSSSSSSSSSPDMDDMRDSVRDAARNGASEAVKSAGAPTVIPRMAAGFRGLGSIASAGGTSSSGDSKRKLSAPTKSNVSAKQSTMVNPVASAGYKGVANTPKTGNKSGIEKLRAQGDAQGGYFSGANAIKALDNANGVKISDIHGEGPGSGFGGGSMGGGEGYKGPSNGGPHDSHKHSGKCQTLACQAAEARQKKALEWEFFWRYDVPKKIAETFINALTKGAADWLVGKIFGDKDSPKTMVCAQSIVSPIECVKGKVIPVMESSTDKTVDSWKQDVCNCGKWTKPEFEKNFGNPDGSNKPDNPTQREDNFSTFIADYDTGLKEFMGDLASVRKNSESKKGIKFAKKAVNTYITTNPGEGIGQPFDQLFILVNREAEIDDTNNKNNKTKLADVKVKFTTAKSQGSQFMALLEEVKKDPEKYRIKNTDTENNIVASSSSVSEIIDIHLGEYKKLYEIYISSEEANIAGFGAAFDVLDKYIAESKDDNTKVHEEYKDIYVTYLKKLDEEVLESTSKPDIVIDDFMKKIDGRGTKEQKVSKILVKSERILCSPDDGDIMPRTNPASAKIRTWRGFKPDMGTSEKEKGELKDIYENASKEVKKRETDNWKEDNPLNDVGAPKKAEDIPLNKDGISLMQKEHKEKPEFYAPGYRIIVEIPAAIDLAQGKLNSIGMNLGLLKEKQDAIIKDLKENHIDINGGNQGGGDNGGNGGNQGGGDNGGNGGNQGGGDNGGNGGNQGGTPQSIVPSVCADPNHCTDAEIRKLEKEARQSGKYNKGNKELNPVWNEYNNPVSGMEKVTVNPEGATYQDYNNSRGKVHTLRNRYDQLASQLKNSANLSQEERDAIKDEMDRVYENYEQELAETNKKWKEVCIASVNQGNPKLTMNYCNGKGGPVNHNTTNTTVPPKPTNTTTSSTNPTVSNGQQTAGSGKLPETLENIIFSKEMKKVDVYDEEDNIVTVKVCDGLLSEGYPDVCLSYARIKSAAVNPCFMYTENGTCNKIREGKLYADWPAKQLRKYGKLIPKKDRKLNGQWHKVQVKADMISYYLAYSNNAAVLRKTPQPLPQLNGSADKEYGAWFSSAKPMEQFILRTSVKCNYDKTAKVWRFGKVTLTTEKGSSNDSQSLSMNIGADVPGVKISVGATLGHSETTYNFGKENNYSDKFTNQICR
jgi:hypothetical protein